MKGKDGEEEGDGEEGKREKKRREGEELVRG